MTSHYPHFLEQEPYRSLHLLNWNLNPKLSTLAWGGSTSQKALVMLYDNLVAYRQSQAGALSHRFGSEEGVE